MSKHRWAITGAAVAVVLAISASAVMAQTPPTPAAGTSFLDRVAQKLGIETPKLQDAVTGARTDQIDAAVQNGDLTQKQADALKSKVNSAHADGLSGRGFGQGFGAKGFGAQSHVPTGQQLADFLGITADQLKTELKASGATWATVALAHGESRDDLKAFITSTAKGDLDAKVQSQDLTQKQEDSVLQQLSSRLDKIVDGHGRSGFDVRGHGGKPKVAPSPAATAPQG